MKILLEAGADVMERYKYDDSTPLHAAIFADDAEEKVKILQDADYIFIEELTSLGLEVSSQVKVKKDTIIDIDMTPNRADCLSVIGIARDLSSIYKSKISLPKAIKFLKLKHSNISSIDKKISPSYSALIIKNIDNSLKTPIFIKNRLDICGLKTINFVVDVLNYVML